jgi:pimeloyl-ACP methyl ester carboxylesterase
MFDIRLGERVKRLPMPVIVVGGDADALIPVANMLASWAKYPAGTGLHFWHGIGHSPNLDCPAELAALLQRFIETTIPARAAKAPA